MSLIGWVLVVVFVAGILLGAYALMAPRRRAEPSRALQRDEDRSDSGWPESAGTEFG